VGDVVLEPCDVIARALCGSIWRRWEPDSSDVGKLKIGFALVPPRDDTRPALGTVVPHEGGPGYSTTGSAWGYRKMYGPLLDRRNMLLVDQRGTGLSRPIRCDDLQNLKIAYAVAAGRCGRQLGPRADDYTTALATDDTAAVIRRLGLSDVDLYGDSYGTFFQQVFVGRHPDLVRSVVLDSAYPTYGETGWYPTQGLAMRRAFTAACDRSRACRAAGEPFLVVLRSVLRKVRQEPWRGTAHDADGRRMRVAVSPENLAVVAYGATYAPVFYREFTAALRSALRGYRAPLLRLVAEATGGGTNAGPVVAYSEGLDAAVACHDYPQLYDMTARPGRTREEQLVDALDRRHRNWPRTYGPFTVHEYARSDWETLSWCTRWPTAPPDNPAEPPRPPVGYPDLPVLILSGELDSITTAAEGDIVASQFPDARHLVLRNQFHVNAAYDFEGCGQSLVRQFTRDPDAALSRCGEGLAPVRTMGRFPARIGDVLPGESAELRLRARRVPRAAALVVADVMDRWWNNYSGWGVGLHGGRWSYRGYGTVRFRLHNVELVAGQRVSGTATWDRSAKRVTVDLGVRGKGPDAHLRGRWHSRNEGALARLRGKVGGVRAEILFSAP
jgi:pimeloyl-ACP methyl ester carboxylesterase